MELRAFRWRPTLRGGSLSVGFALGVAVALAIVAVSQQARLTTANLDYTVSIGAGAHPVTSNGQVAAIARHYLDAQTSSLAAPNLHEPPVVVSETATLARDAAQLEPGIPAAQVAAQPDRVVWIVRVSGDLLDLHDMTWSSAGAPYPEGDIVVDDATEVILGVYPHAPGTF